LTALGNRPNSRNTSVDIVTRLQAGQQMNYTSIPCKFVSFTSDRVWSPYSEHFSGGQCG